MRISDWSSDVCSSDLANTPGVVDAMPIVRPSGRSRLAVLVKPVPAGSWPDHRNRPAAMLFIRDPEANAPSGAQELARRLLGLTRVETRLAMFLTEIGRASCRERVCQYV